MIVKLGQRFSERDFRIVVVLVVALISIPALSWLVVPQLRQTLALHQQLAATAAVSPAADGSEARLQALQNMVKQLEDDYARDGTTATRTLVEAETIAAIQHVSSLTGVTLDGVRPDAHLALGEFEELTFDVRLSGGYPEIRRWLAEIERALGHVVVKNYAMGPLQRSSGRTVSARLTLALYRSAL